eukprot:scaffold203135_cov36-Tisochrysis_lutea.AAC.1
MGHGATKGWGQDSQKTGLPAMARTKDTHPTPLSLKVYVTRTNFIVSCQLERAAAPPSLVVLF